MFVLTVIAVAKVVVAVCIGAITFRKVPHISVTMRDFTFLLSNLLLPSLTFYNTAKSVNVSVLIHSSILFLFSLSVIGFGALCALVMSKIFYRVDCMGIPRELRNSLRYTLLYCDAEGKLVSATSRHLRRRKVQGTALRHVVGVVVSGVLEEQRVGADELLSLLEPPGEDYELQPFYHYASLIGCSLQNTVTIPLSLLQSLASSLKWVDLAAGTSYIFIYSITSSISLWSFGPLFVDRAKKETHRRRKIRELLEQHKKLYSRRSVATQTEMRGRWSLAKDQLALNRRQEEDAEEKEVVKREERETNISSDFLLSDNEACEPGASQPPARQIFFETTTATSDAALHDWREDGLIRVVYSREFKEETDSEDSKFSSFADILHSLKLVLLQLLRMMALVSVFLGFIVGVTPPLRWLFFEGPFSILMNTIALLSEGSIPSSLLLLGANLAGITSMINNRPELRLRDAEQNTEVLFSDDEENSYYTEEYRKSFEMMEFDEHASFTLSALKQRFQLPNFYVEIPDNTRANSFGILYFIKRRFNSICQKFFGCGIWKSFIFVILFVRLLLIPSVGFSLVILLKRIAPTLFASKGEVGQHNVLILVLLGELAAPTAINCTLLFNMKQYMPEKWSMALFFQYILCTITLVLWCTVSLVIVG